MHTQKHTCKILLKHSSALGCNGLHCSDANKWRIRAIIQVRNATSTIIIMKFTINISKYLQWFKSGVDDARKQEVKLLAIQLSVIAQDDSWIELFNCRDTMVTNKDTCYIHYICILLRPG